MTDLPEVPPGANMENCPRCTDPNPDYPWICPGHPAERVAPAGVVDSDIYAHLRRVIGTAIRDAAHGCFGDCGLDELACLERYPVQVFARHFGEVGTVTAEVTDLVDLVVKTLFTNERHGYFSTGCLHGDHLYCQQRTGRMGLKNPAECKFCSRTCLCTCHDEADPE